MGRARPGTGRDGSGRRGPSRWRRVVEAVVVGQLHSKAQPARMAPWVEKPATYQVAMPISRPPLEIRVQT